MAKGQQNSEIFIYLKLYMTSYNVQPKTAIKLMERRIGASKQHAEGRIHIRINKTLISPAVIRVLELYLAN